MKYVKSAWPNWNQEDEDSTICVGDQVHIPYDELFIADGWVSKLLPATDEVEITLSYLHNFSDESRAQKGFYSHCLEFPRDFTKVVKSSDVTFLSGDAQDEE